MDKKKIVLGMIVKNEAHVIERCLSSVLPLIDSWCIVDTGSTDGTQQKIKEFFEALGIEGKLHEKPWVNFGHNRSEVLELSRDMGDYTLMIDADEIMEYSNDFDPEKFRQELSADVYNVFAFFGSTKYHRPQLTSNKLKFYYRGVCHEYVDCHDEIKTRAFAPGILNRPIQDGARSKDSEKYLKDAKLFEDALASGKVDEKDFNRYHFYLAQSYRDAKEYEKAIQWYQKRASLGGWNEEVFFSLLQIANIKEYVNQSLKDTTKYNIDDIIATYCRSHEVNPWRAEPLICAARLARVFGRFDQAYRFARMASRLRNPEGALFVNQDVYTFGIAYEYALSAFFTENYSEAKKAAESLINNNNSISEEIRKQMEELIKHSVQNILAQ